MTCLLISQLLIKELSGTIFTPNYNNNGPYSDVQSYLYMHKSKDFLETVTYTFMSCCGMIHKYIPQKHEGEKNMNTAYETIKMVISGKEIQKKRE